MTSPRTPKVPIKHRNKSLVPGDFPDSVLEESADNIPEGDIPDSPVSPTPTPNY